ncbi:hypothetical protein GCM10009789_81140 [Kribbella sancticallisti]|uniref:Uncharacterized protein n=1 Tax=Kribbella sancticallisti TaxID=460087 RepID=A0ABP4QLC3_9ACTN
MTRRWSRTSPPPTSPQYGLAWRRRSRTSGPRCATPGTPTTRGPCSCRPTYPSPIPAGNGFRYGQTGYTRQSVGGCGFWNADADWANATALTTINNTVRAAITQSGLSNTRLLELQSTFNGRRLCEKTVGLYEEVGLTSWRQSTAVDKTEWVNQIRTVTTVGSNYYLQESIHPNYWGQLAVRSCVRQSYHLNRGGTCAIAGTGILNGEPRMTLS